MSKGAAMTAFAQCNKAAAAQHLKSHLQANPSDVEARMWKAESHWIIQQVSEAVNEYTQIMHWAYSDSAEYAIASAWLNSITDGRLDKNLLTAELRKVVVSHPESAWAHYRLGMAQGPDTPERLSALKQAASADRRNFWFQVNYALELEVHQQTTEAGSYYMRAVELNDNLTLGHMGLARQALIRQLKSEAESHFEKANSMNPAIAPKWILDDIATDEPILHNFPIMVIMYLGITLKDVTETTGRSSKYKNFDTTSTFDDVMSIMDLVPIDKLTYRRQPNGKLEMLQGPVCGYNFVLRTGSGPLSDNTPTLEVSPFGEYDGLKIRLRGGSNEQPVANINVAGNSAKLSEYGADGKKTSRCSVS